MDDDAQADKKAENTLAEIAHAVGLKDIAFQYEPIAAAFDYESQIRREELVLVVDIGGGTSDFALVRLSPERARKAERRDDILASGGVHIGGTDFDKYLSLASVMPTLGLGSRLVSGLEVPSAQYFNLATWHTINQVYSKKSWTQISDIRRGAVDKDKLDRLQNLVRERAGHWLAMQVEAAKIALSDAPEAVMDLGRIAPGETLTLHRPDFDGAISELVGTVSRTVTALLKDAGVNGGRYRHRVLHRRLQRRALAARADLRAAAPGAQRGRRPLRQHWRGARAGCGAQVRLSSWFLRLRPTAAQWQGLRRQATMARTCTIVHRAPN